MAGASPIQAKLGGIESSLCVNQPWEDKKLDEQNPNRRSDERRDRSLTHCKESMCQPLASCNKERPMSAPRNAPDLLFNLSARGLAVLTQSQSFASRLVASPRSVLTTLFLEVGGNSSCLGRVTRDERDPFRYSLLMVVPQKGFMALSAKINHAVAPT